MCVLVEDYDTKIVKLAPFPVTATRISPMQMELQRVEYRLEWNAVRGTFETVVSGGDVKIVPAPQQVKPTVQTPDNPENEVKTFRVVGEDTDPANRRLAFVNGYVYVTVEFLREDGSVAWVLGYLYIGGEFWYQDSTTGTWYSTPDFTFGSFTSHQSLPPQNATPPPHREGGGDQNQQ